MSSAGRSGGRPSNLIGLLIDKNRLLLMKVCCEGWVGDTQEEGVGN